MIVIVIVRFSITTSRYRIWSFPLLGGKDNGIEVTLQAAGIGLRGGGGGDSDIKWTGVLAVLGFKKLFHGMPLRVVSRQRSAFAVPFRVLSRNNLTGDTLLL